MLSFLLLRFESGATLGHQATFVTRCYVELIYTSHFYYLCGLSKQYKINLFIKPRRCLFLAIVRPFSLFSTHRRLQVFFFLRFSTPSYFKMIMVVL